MANQELRIIPHPNFSHSHTHVPSGSVSAPSAPGVYDRLRGSLHPQTGHVLVSSHPLEARLSQWTQTRENLKHTLLQREFGLSAPLQREMELMTVRSAAWGSMAGFMGMSMGAGRSLHEDILMGRDAEIDWEDVYPGPGWGEYDMGGAALGGDFHTVMEHRLGMDW